MIIAIDGPSGAGKSSVAKAVAQRLGFSCLDTGAMYRAIAWKMLDVGCDPANSDAVGALAHACVIGFEHEPGDPQPRRVTLDGRDVTQAIRTAAVDRAVSAASAIPAVREALVAQQQRMGATDDFVVEGRDIGTTVFPSAEVKVFLTASDEERARRRVAQNRERGVGSTDYREVLADIVRRDQLDSSRAASPLVQADDAVVIDSSDMSFSQVVDAICNLAEMRMG